ncbi:MAG: 3-deoxy-manno-octulosonate cytidylyltransferase [Planctomycetes bacterium]|nr:3-deoxy-manno-octulosonate cytidylyltransferase [Planctomycetota bacterium]
MARHATAIIPARYASTRLPGKALLDETGKALICHVVEAVRPARCLKRIVVATDDRRIARAAEEAGAEAVMTRPDHRCGSDRLAEAADLLGLGDDEIVVNVQGDEPEIPPACIETLVELLARTDCPAATLLADLPAELAGEPARVKCVTDLAGRALYFSRSVIPHDRNSSAAVAYKLHLGLYAYRAGFLRTFTKLPPTPAETAEKLEQLRILEHGYRIATATVDYDGAGIDTPEDYRAFVRRWRQRH